MAKRNMILGLTAGLFTLCTVSALAAAPSDKDLALLYTFDDIKGNKVVDASGNKLDGQIDGAPVQTAGIVGKALAFDGEGTFVLLPEKALDKLTEFSVAVWARVDEKRMWSRLWDLGSGTDNYIFLTPFSGFQSVMAEAKPEGTNLIAHRSPQFDAAWHHTVVSVKGKTVKLYFDGKEVAYNTFADDFTPNYQAWWSLEQNYLGKSQFGADALFKGALDEFRIYKRALTDDEVSSLATK